MQKKISIIMGIYNCENYIKEAIESLICQTYTNWELIMCDDGSKDHTFNIALEYQKKWSKKIILLKNDKNMGLNYTLNKCLGHVTGEYVARQDGDDISVLDRFEKQIEILKTKKEISFVGSNMEMFDENGVFGKTNLSEIPTKKDFIYGSPFCHATMMIDLKAINSVNGYSEGIKLIRVEDYHLWFKLYEKGYKGYNIKDCLYKMRDDKNACLRRTWQNRRNEVYVKYIGFKMLKIPLIYYPYIIKPLLVGMLNKKIYKKLHTKKLRRNL